MKGMPGVQLHFDLCTFQTHSLRLIHIMPLVFLLLWNFLCFFLGQFYVMMSPQEVLQGQRTIAPRTHTIASRTEGGRSNRDERRRATHNEGENGTYTLVFGPLNCHTQETHLLSYMAGRGSHILGELKSIGATAAGF